MGGQDRDRRQDRAPRDADVPVKLGTPGKTALTDLIPTARTGRPMRTLDRRDRAPGRMTSTAGLSRAGQATRATAAPSPGEGIAQLTDGGARLDEIALSFELPSGLVLSRNFIATAQTVQTSGSTHGVIAVSEDRMTISFVPRLLLDVNWPINNLLLHSVAYDFDSGAMVIDLQVDESVFAFGDMRGRAQTEMIAIFRRMIQGTTIAQRGYDPFADQNITATLRELVSRFQTLAPAPPAAPAPAASPPGPTPGRGTGYGTSPPAPVTDLSLAKVGKLGGSVTVTATRELVYSEGGQGVRLPAGGSVALAIRAENAADRIASGASSVQAGIESAKVMSVHVAVEPPLELLLDGAPAILLEDVTIYTGGRVEVGTFTLHGVLARAAGWEALIRTVGAVGKLGAVGPSAAHGVPARIMGAEAERVVVADAMRDMVPRTVAAATREQLERRLSNLVRALIAEHGQVIPGIDLRPILG